jgi:peptide/nickel transport system substrate-binding protein
MSELRVTQTSVTLGDPHICSDSRTRLSLQAAIYESLVSRTGPGRFTPQLAENWETRDGRVWEFLLRDEVKAHNGASFEASDAAANLKRIVNPKVGGAFGTEGVYSSYLGKATFNAARRLRLIITLPEPMADLLELLVEMPMLPENVMDDLPDRQIGTGRYMVRDGGKEGVTLESNPHYWGARSRYERVHWRGVGSEADRLNLVKKGDTDVASGLSWIGREEANRLGVSTVSQPGYLSVIFMFNCSSGPCTDAKVRRALNYATDVEEINREVMHGAADRLNGPFTPHHFGYNTETRPYPHDPEEAKRLLIEAKRSDLSITMDVPSVMPDESVLLSQVLTKQWEEAGVNVRTRVHGHREQYSHMVRDKKIGDLCCFDSSPLSSFRVLREKIHSRLKGPWWEGYENPRVDSLIDEAQAMVNSEDRRKIYRNVYQIIRDDAPWIFLYSPRLFYALSKVDWQPSWDGVIRIK